MGRWQGSLFGPVTDANDLECNFFSNVCCLESSGPFLLNPLGPNSQILSLLLLSCMFYTNNQTTVGCSPTTCQAQTSHKMPDTHGFLHPVWPPRRSVFVFFYYRQKSWGLGEVKGLGPGTCHKGADADLGLRVSTARAPTVKLVWAWDTGVRAIAKDAWRLEAQPASLPGQPAGWASHP